MRFSFKKTLATVLSIAMILSAFVGVLTTSAAAANVVGTLTMDDVTATANTENKFDVVANIALDAEASYVHVAYKLGTLPEGVALDSVASNVGSAIIDAETGAILVDAGADAVSAIAVTMTFVAPATALEAFTLAVEAVDYADVDENDDTIDITDTAVITVISHGPAADLCQGNGTHHWYPCVVEGCTEHKYGEDWHAWKTDTITPPTCTEPGVGNKYCDCGRGWGNVEIPATGVHNYVYADNGDGTHTITCTVGGETDVADCTFVDGVCEFCKGIEVTECAHEYGEEITTAPTCTEPGVKTFTCSKCGDSYTEPVDALGHTYDSYVLIDANTHKKICACGDEVVEAHTTGACVCGYDSTLKIVGNNGVFEAAYSLVYYVRESHVKAYDDLKLEIKQENFVKEGNNWVAADPKVSYLTLDNIRRDENGDPLYYTTSGIKMYQFELTGIAPKEVANDITARIVATKDGVVSYGVERNYNLVTYAMSKANGGNALANAMISFLNFASAAQTHFKYNAATEADLANAGLTAEQKTVTLATALTDDSAKSGAGTITIAGFNVGFESQIEMVVYLKPGDYDYTGHKLVATYTKTDGTTVTDKVDLTGITEKYSGLLTVRYTGIAAKDMRAIVALYVEDASGNKISNDRNYSLTTYANGQAGKGTTLEALTKALIVFGDAMKIYKS